MENNGLSKVRGQLFGILDQQYDSTTSLVDLVEKVNAKFQTMQNSIEASGNTIRTSKKLLAEALNYRHGSSDLDHYSLYGLIDQLIRKGTLIDMVRDQVASNLATMEQELTVLQVQVPETRSELQQRIIELQITLSDKLGRLLEIQASLLNETLKSIDADDRRMLLDIIMGE